MPKRYYTKSGEIIWINLKYEFNNHRPSVDEEDESENSDS